MTSHIALLRALNVGGYQLYVVCPAGIGRSRLRITMIERKLRARATGRNWNTVLKLRALATRDPIDAAPTRKRWLPWHIVSYIVASTSGGCGPPCWAPTTA